MIDRSRLRSRRLSETALVPLPRSQVLFPPNDVLLFPSTPLIWALLPACAVLLSWNWQLRRRLRRSLRALQRSEASAQTTLAAIPDLLFEVDGEGRYLAVQALQSDLLVEQQERLLGHSIEEVLPARASSICMLALREAAARGTSHGHQLLLPLPGGERWFELSIARKPGAPGQQATFVILSRDIHDRRMAREDLERQIRFYSVLSRCNRSILASRSEAELMESFCREAISTGVLRMAWIGMVDPDSERVHPQAWAGDGTDYLRDIEISRSATSPFGTGPTGMAIREDKPIWCQDFQHDPATAPWHARAARFGWLSSASLPLHRQGISVGALIIYAAEADAFTPAVRQLLRDMAADLDLALERFTREAEQERLREELIAGARQYRELTETINDVVWRVEAVSLRPLYFSPAVQQIWGYSAAEVLQGLPRRAYGPRFRRWRRQRRKDVQRWLRQDGDSQPIRFPLEELELRHPRGEAIWVENSISLVPSGSSGRPEFHGVSRDITARKLAERQVERLAHFDPLTGLANRERVNQEFASILASSRRDRQSLAVMLLNLNRFQQINDSLGTHAGDQLLVETALRLRCRLQHSDLVARVNGDEFLIISPTCSDADAVLLAETLLAAVAQPWLHNNQQVVVTANIGIAMAPQDGQDHDVLTRKASLALHAGKREKPNSHRFFTEELQVRTARSLLLSNALRFALERQELRLVYQPQVDTASGAMLAAEALLRWWHPQLGDVSPDEFIPIAERNGMILPIGHWVLSAAIRQLRDWIAAGVQPPRLAVNLSALQFRQSELAEQLAALLADAHVPASLLEFELTETAAMQNPEAAELTIQALARLGICFAIDDFGTGYSSLSTLRRLHAVKLKIDASFIRELDSSADDRAIVSGIIHLARGMGMRTLAEGVETAQQHRFLLEQGCDEIQGYWFARPLPPADLLAYAAQPPRLHP